MCFKGSSIGYGSGLAIRPRARSVALAKRKRRARNVERRSATSAKFPTKTNLSVSGANLLWASAGDVTYGVYVSNKPEKGRLVFSGPRLGEAVSEAGKRTQWAWVWVQVVSLGC